MKKPEYAAGVTAIYRKYIDMYYEKGSTGFKVSKEDMDNLSKLYIRSEIQDGYYFRHNGKEMITPGKPSYSGVDDGYLQKIRQTYIEQGKKIPVEMYGFFLAGEKAVLNVTYKDISVSLEGNIVDTAQNRPMTKADIEKQLLKLGNTVFVCEELNTEVGDAIFIPNKALNDLRRNILQLLEDEIIKNNGFDICRTDDRNPEKNVAVANKSVTNKEFTVFVTTREQLHVLENLNYCYDRVYLDYQLMMELNEAEIDVLAKRWTLGVVYPRIIRKNAFKMLDEIYNKSRNVHIAVVKNLEA